MKSRAEILPDSMRGLIKKRRKIQICAHMLPSIRFALNAQNGAADATEQQIKSGQAAYFARYDNWGVVNMNSNAIMINGIYGCRIGNIQVFTRSGAIEAYKAFAKHVYDRLSPESCVALSKAAEDMHAIGFEYEEIEQMEIDVIENPAN